MAWFVIGLSGLVLGYKYIINTSRNREIVEWALHNPPFQGELARLDSQGRPMTGTIIPLDSRGQPMSNIIVPQYGEFAL